jgi:hypothetical protein
MSSLVSRSGGAKLRAQVKKDKGSQRQLDLTTGILDHFNSLHSVDYWPDKKIEQQLIDDDQKDINSSFSDVGLVNGVIMFSPSSASKCPRELFFKATKTKKDKVTAFPYQRRWTRNSTAVHRAVQKDLLYAEKVLPAPLFRVKKTPDGRPSWEKNIAHVVQVEHEGTAFQLYGMMDAILEYTPDGSTVGFEFKTKSTTIAAVGDFKMKEASSDHVTQCSGYSLLFGVDEFLIVYESVAKDSWMKGEEARPDMRAFYIEVKDEDRTRLLDKFAEIAENYYSGEISRPDYSKCLFCPYKTRCKEVGL